MSEQLNDNQNGGKREKNSFWDMFRFTKNGRPQSTAILMSFSYSLLFLAIYMAAYFLLLDPIHALFGSGPVWLDRLAESLLPALAGAVVCALPMLIAQEKRFIPMAYVWLLAYSAASLIAMLAVLWDDVAARAIFLSIYGMTVPETLVLGGGLAIGLYVRYRRNHQPLLP